MKENEKKLPKATAEIVSEYNELKKILCAEKFSSFSEKFKAASERMVELENSYDWFNFEFTDPVTEKKGLKTVTGEVIVPALYDGFCEFHSFLFEPHAPVIAVKNGKWGIVKGNGSGQEVCEFKFDSIASAPFCTLFFARWDGEKERFGIIAVDGEIVCPNILTSYGEPFNGVMTIESDGKHGIIDIDSYQCVLPEYDELEIDNDDYVIFHKGNQKGYVTENGEFVTLEQYDSDDNYIDVPVLSTRLI